MTEFVEGTFLGLPESEGEADVAILSIPYELTTSYGQGTQDGPEATIRASAQVELYDPLLPEDLPCGFTIHTAEPWGGEETVCKNNSKESPITSHSTGTHFQSSSVENMGCCRPS